MPKAARPAALRTPQTSPDHASTLFHSTDNREETQLALSHCPYGAPVGLSQDSVPDPRLLRRDLAASEHQFVNEVALLKDPCVDATFVLQYPMFAAGAFRTSSLFEESGRLPFCAARRGRW